MSRDANGEASREAVLHGGPREHAAMLANGHAIDPEALPGSYRGTSLGLPKWIERATWTTFRKVFARGRGGTIGGWNVRVEQEPPHHPRLKDGKPWIFGHYEVVPMRPSECPLPVGEGVLLDYGRGENPALDPTRVVRDPLVALTPGGVEILLGYTYVRVLGRSFGTPSWFLLEREPDA